MEWSSLPLLFVGPHDFFSSPSRRQRLWPLQFHQHGQAQKKRKQCGSTPSQKSKLQSADKTCTRKDSFSRSLCTQASNWYLVPISPPKSPEARSIGVIQSGVATSQEQKNPAVSVATEKYFNARTTWRCHPNSTRNVQGPDPPNIKKQPAARKILEMPRKLESPDETSPDVRPRLLSWIDFPECNQESPKCAACTVCAALPSS